MKYRIIAMLLLAAALGGAVVLMDESTPAQPTALPAPSAPASSDFKSFKIP